MCPEEFWLEFDSKMKEQKKAGNFAGRPAAAAFSEAEWEAARRKVKDL